MARALLLRGMVAGALAGVFAVAFAWLFGEPQLELASGFEAAMQHAAGHTAEPELVSREVQSSAGLLVAGLAIGVALGGFLALAFTLAYQRIAHTRPRVLAALLAITGFIAVVAVPQIKYPANPPSIGISETIGLRTALYFEMILIAIGGLLLAVLLGRALLTRVGKRNAMLIGILSFVCIVTALQFALPDINEVPDGFPTDVLWRFRLASLGTQFVLWAALGVIFGMQAERVVSAQAPAISNA